MNKPILSRYRVDNIPLVLKPIFYLFGYGMGTILFFASLLLRITIKVEITGQENLREHSNHIFCHWHSSVPLATLCAVPSIFPVLGRGSYAFMQHPSWYMKPCHVLLRLMGIEKIILGSTGHSGRKAADQLVEYLKRGYSTVVMPDGPNGPPFILKKGILHMSLQTEVPIVAMQFISSDYFEFNTWDRKKLSYPFSMIKLKIGNPIQVNSDNFTEVQNKITGALEER